MLYIANATRQHIIFHYRVPEHTRAFFVRIPSGGQEKLGKHWSGEQLKAVCDQLVLIGGKRVPEISGKMEGFSGLVFSDEKPVKAEKIEQASEVVLDMAEKRSVDVAQKAARTFDLTTRESKGRGRRLAKETAVEVMQEPVPGERPTGDEVNFKHVVSAEA